LKCAFELIKVAESILVNHEQETKKDLQL